MSRSTQDPATDFEQLARQYWQAWSGLAGSPAAGRATPGLQDGLAWWSKLAAPGNGEVEAALERMNAQAGQWFGAMQQLAAGFAGRDAAAADIASAWRSMLGAGGSNPLADLFSRMGGPQAQGVEAWMAQAAPQLSAMRGELGSLLRLPAFGLAREHQERLQQLAQAQLDYQERNADYQALLAGAARNAFERFESLLSARAEPGRQIESARALFDLWIDAAEEAWSELALSPEYRHAYGRMVNSLMRLRAAMQKEIEVAAGVFGLPTRSELDASHRKLAALEREVRALRLRASGDVVAEAEAPADPAPAARTKQKQGAAKPARTAASTARAKAASKSKPKPKPRTRSAAPSAPRPARKPMLPQVAAPKPVRTAGRVATASRARKGG